MKSPSIFVLCSRNVFSNQCKKKLSPRIICTTQIIREKQVPTAVYWTNIVIPFDHFVWIIVKVTILETLINFTFSDPNPVLEPLLEVLF